MPVWQFLSFTHTHKRAQTPVIFYYMSRIDPNLCEFSLNCLLKSWTGTSDLSVSCSTRPATLPLIAQSIYIAGKVVRLFTCSSLCLILSIVSFFDVACYGTGSIIYLFIVLYNKLVSVGYNQGLFKLKLRRRVRYLYVFVFITHLVNLFIVHQWVKLLFPNMITRYYFFFLCLLFIWVLKTVC